MTSIIIASNNRVKVEAIKKAFTDFLGDKLIQATGFDADSEVERQPFDEKVFEGAYNRLQNLKKMDKEADFFISCEGGVVKIHDTYYNIHVVVIEDKNGNQSRGVSQGYPIPQKYINEIKETSIAHVLDEIFEGKGGIRMLSNGLFTRDKLIYDGTIMALTGIMSGNQWSITTY